MKRHAVVVCLLALTAFTCSALAVPIHGTVSRAGTRQHAARALVVFSGFRGDEIARTITGNDGRYFVRDIAEGQYSVTISYHGRSRSYSGVVVTASRSVLDFETP